MIGGLAGGGAGMASFLALRRKVKFEKLASCNNYSGNRRSCLLWHDTVSNPQILGLATSQSVYQNQSSQDLASYQAIQKYKPQQLTPQQLFEAEEIALDDSKVRNMTGGKPVKLMSHGFQETSRQILESGTQYLTSMWITRRR